MPSGYGPTKTRAFSIACFAIAVSSISRASKRFVVEAWAPTVEEASDLAQLARAHILATENEQHAGALLYRAFELGAPGDDPDPLSGDPRFTATYRVTARGVALDTAS